MNYVLVPETNIIHPDNRTEASSLSVSSMWVDYPLDNLPLEIVIFLWIILSTVRVPHGFSFVNPQPNRAREVIATGEIMKTCKRCGNEKDLDQFRKVKDMKEGCANT